MYRYGILSQSLKGPHFFTDFEVATVGAFDDASMHPTLKANPQPYYSPCTSGAIYFNGIGMKYTHVFMSIRTEMYLCAQGL